MFVIQSTDGVPTYYSDDTSIHPAGSWGDKIDAKTFASEKEAKLYLKDRLFHQAEFCKIVSI